MRVRGTGDFFTTAPGLNFLCAGKGQISHGCNCKANHIAVSLALLYSSFASETLFSSD